MNKREPQSVLFWISAIIWITTSTWHSINLFSWYFRFFLLQMESDEKYSSLITQTLHTTHEGWPIPLCCWQHQGFTQLSASQTKVINPYIFHCLVCDICTLYVILYMYQKIYHMKWSKLHNCATHLQIFEVSYFLISSCHFP